MEFCVLVVLGTGERRGKCAVFEVSKTTQMLHFG